MPEDRHNEDSGSKEGAAEFPELPRSVIEATKDLIERVPDDIFLDFVRVHPELQKGSFKPVRKNLPVFRERLKGRISFYFETSSLFRLLIYEADLGASFLFYLSVDMIHDGLDAFLVFFGPARFITAMITDEREEVRKLANYSLEMIDWKGMEGQDRGVALADIRDIFTPFLDEIRPFLDDSVNQDQALVDQPKDGAAGLVKGDLQKENERLRRELDSRDVRIAKIERANRSLEEQIKMERQAGETASRELKSQRQEMATLRVTIEKEAQEAMREESEQERRYWLDPPKLVEAEVNDEGRRTRHQDLLERVKAVLKRQEDKDRHFGNIAELRLRLDALTKAREAIKTARASALHPLPDLGEYEKELDKEIARITELLGLKADKSLLYSSLEAHINGYKSPELLREATVLIERLAQIGALSVKDADGLYGLYHRKMGQLYGEYGQVQRAPLSGPVIGGSAGKLQRALDRGDPYLLVIDGHNLLMGLHDVLYDDSGPVYGSEGREWLADRVARLVSRSPSCETVIYFDGPEFSEAARSLNVKVVYSGGTGSDRADRRILDYLAFRAKEQKQVATAIVTNDRSLADHARRLGASIISVRDFEVLLG